MQVSRHDWLWVGMTVKMASKPYQLLMYLFILSSEDCGLMTVLMTVGMYIAVNTELRITHHVYRSHLYSCSTIHPVGGIISKKC